MFSVAAFGAKKGVGRAHNVGEQFNLINATQRFTRRSHAIAKFLAPKPAPHGVEIGGGYDFARH